MIFRCGTRNRKEKIISLAIQYGNNLNPEFIQSICEEKKNKIVCHCVSSYFDYEKITTILVYRRLTKANYALFVLVVHPSVRATGYGTLILQDFIQRHTSLKSIVLHSLPESINFYKNMGFRKIKRCAFLEKNETIENIDKLIGSFMELRIDELA